MNLSNTRTRRKYDASFKEDVIKMISAGRPVAELSAALGVSDSLIRRWYKDAQSKTPQKTTQSSITQQQSSSEIERLKAELRRTEQERDILKKALGIFSRGV
ncbi:MAG: transposase [Chitinophagaceae bacterium]